MVMNGEGSDVISEALFREFVTEAVNETIRRCGSKWCLYSKHKKDGKSKRLGTHPSKTAAARQESYQGPRRMNSLLTL